MALQPNSSYGLTFFLGGGGGLNNNLFMGLDLVQRQTPKLEDQVSIFMTPGDRVVQLYHKALGSTQH
jgi:hypothetical protein